MILIIKHKVYLNKYVTTLAFALPISRLFLCNLHIPLYYLLVKKLKFHRFRGAYSLDRSLEDEYVRVAEEWIAWVRAHGSTRDVDQGDHKDDRGANSRSTWHHEHHWTKLLVRY